MTTINYVGAAIANYKSVKLSPGVNAIDPSAVVQIGLGPYLLTLTGGWNATSLANLWNSSANPYFKTITATVSGSSVVLTANNLGQDFEPVCTINGTAVQVSALMTFSIIASGGTFTLSDGTLTTGAITYNATPATLITNMLAAINALAGYTSGDVAITYSVDTGLYTFDFSGGQFAGVNIPTWTANAGSLTGGTAAATIARNQTGNAGTDEIISITFPADGTHTENLNTIQQIVMSSTSGAFTLTVAGFGTTAVIPYNAGRSTIKRILEDLIGQDNSIVTGGPLSVVNTGVTSATLIAESDAAYGETAGTPDSYDAAATSIQISSPVVPGGAVSLNATVTTTTAAVAGNNLKYKYVLASTPTGNFYFKNGSYTSSLMPTNASLPVLQAALDSIYGVNNTIVTGSLTDFTNGIVVEFIHSLKGKQSMFSPAYTSTKYNLGLANNTGAASPTRSTVQAATAGTDEQQTFTLNVAPADGTQFYVHFDGRVAGPFSFTGGICNQTALQITTACCAVFNANSLPTNISGDYIGDAMTSDGLVASGLHWDTTHPLIFAFTGCDYQGTNVPLVTLTATTSDADADHNGAIRFTTAIANAATIQAATLKLTPDGSAHTTPCVIKVQAVKATDPALPANAAACYAATLTTASVTLTVSNPTVELDVDVSAILQELVNQGGFSNGHVVFMIQKRASYGDRGDFGFSSVEGGFAPKLAVSYTTLTPIHYPAFVEFTGALAGTNVPVMTSAGSATATVTITQTGGSQTVQNITGGTWSLVIPNHFTVPNIPYNVTATELQARIVALGGAGCCAVTGGPAPGTPLEIHFQGPLAITAMSPYLTLALTGSFGQTVKLTEVRAAVPTPEATNVYEFVVCPGQGTLALTNGPADTTRFFAVMTILEPNATNPSYDPATSRQVFIPLLNINADRIEGAINEAFGKDVVRVCRTGHSLEHGQLATHDGVSAATNEASFLHFWYYVDTFRLVFVNDYATKASIQQIVVSFAATSNINSTPAGPTIWMDHVSIPTVQNNGSGDVKDMYPEYVRTYLGFVGMEAASTPIHLLSIAPYNSYTSNKLSYKAKLMRQYPFGGGLTTPATPTDQDPNRAGMSRQLIDHTVSFVWHAYQYAINQEAPTSDTVLATSVVIPWDAQPEVFQSSLEGIFGVGNVSVTGSLVNSWLSENDADVPNSELAYQELKITLINQCAYLPFNEFGYGLSMTLSNPFLQDNDTVRSAVPYLEHYSKPLPLQINNRQRVVVQTSTNDAFTIGIGTALVTLTRNSTCSQVQDALNALLGTCVCPAPGKYQRSVTLFGTDFTKPVEIEFTGAGYQFTQQQLVFGFLGASSVGLLTVTQIGINPTQEVQALHITGNPHGGTYTVHGSGNIAYDANALAIQTAVGATPPTVSGTYPDFLFTWPAASGPITLWTTTSALNNSAITIVQTQQGGTVDGVSASLSVSDLAQGQGPLYWDNPANYSPAQVPGSNDVLIFDDATSAVTFGLDQSSIFTVAKLGANARLRHTRLRQVFQNNQKVWLKNQGTAPTGLTLGNYYYVVNQLPDYTFQLSATPGGSPIAITTVGVGPLLLAVHNLEVQIYSRYAGNQIALPNINTGIGLPEYLPRYLKLSGPTMTVGIGDGNALSMLRVDTMTEQATIQVQQSGQSQISNIPAFLFLFNNAASSLNIVDGDCGIAVYSDETSTLGPITGTGGTLLLHATNATSINANGLVVTEQNVLVSGVSSL